MNISQWGQTQDYLCFHIPSKNVTCPLEKYYPNPRTQTQPQVGLTATIPSAHLLLKQNRGSRALERSYCQVLIWQSGFLLGRWGPNPSFDYYYFTTNFPVKSFICAKAHPALSTFFLSLNFIFLIKKKKKKNHSHKAAQIRSPSKTFFPKEQLYRY